MLRHTNTELYKNTHTLTKAPPLQMLTHTKLGSPMWNL